MKLTRIAFLTIAVAAASALATTAASAAPITYSETAVISGSLDGDGFNGETIVISWTGDTSNVASGGGSLLINVAGANAVGFTITNAGSGLFSDAGTEVFVNQNFAGTGAAGFGTSQGSILDTFDNVFMTYDLTTAIGPITNAAFIRSDLVYATTAGNLIISAVRVNSTFEATTTVPEPATLSLLGFGLAAAAAARRRAQARR